MAPVGVIWNVRGISIAQPAAGPMPGSTPISVPSNDPIKANRRFWSVKATENPIKQVLNRYPCCFLL